MKFSPERVQCPKLGGCGHEFFAAPKRYRRFKDNGDDIYFHCPKCGSYFNYNPLVDKKGVAIDRYLPYVPYSQRSRSNPSEARGKTFRLTRGESDVTAFDVLTHAFHYGKAIAVNSDWEEHAEVVTVEREHGKGKSERLRRRQGDNLFKLTLTTPGEPVRVKRNLDLGDAQRRLRRWLDI